MNPKKNYNCDGDKCRRNNGPVRVYPLGGGGNLILCRDCWTHENRYRVQRAFETRDPANWPTNRWADAELYLPDSDPVRA